MSDRFKTILKIIALLAFVTVVGFGFYYLLFGPKPDLTPTTPVSTITPGSLPSAGPAGERPPASPEETALKPSAFARGGLTAITTLTTAPVLSPSLINGEAGYYNPTDGRFYIINSQGESTALLLNSFPSASNVVISSSNNQAILEFPDSTNIVLNLQTGLTTTLPAHWEEFAFTAEDNIVSKALGQDPSNRALTVTTANGTNTKVIAALGLNQQFVTVSPAPNATTLGFSKTGPGGNLFGQQEVYLISADGEADASIIINGSNFKPSWSPSSKNILYSVSDASLNYQDSLWYASAIGDRAGGTRLRLPVQTTADKCVFANETVIYCGVPVSQSIGGSGINPSNSDYLYKLSLPSGTATLLAIPAEKTAINNPVWNPDSELLYFQDEQGRLTSIAL